MSVLLAPARKAPTVNHYSAVIKAGAADAIHLEDLLRTTSFPRSEDAEIDQHLNRLIPKPWGYEYRVYADHMQDLWQLCLRPGQRTSMHAHPRKVTYLMCLKGTGFLAGLMGGREVTAGDIVKIERGAFHQTANISPTENLHLIEVESPRNKFDLVRLHDDYDRVGKGYETRSEDLATEFKKIPYIPGGRMCKFSPEHHFSFDVTAGMDLYYRGLSETALYVPIGVPALLATDLTVLGVSSALGATPHRDTYYLTIELREPLTQQAVL